MTARCILRALQLAPGTVIADRYELVRPLGAGAMGELWSARDRRLDAACAVKILRAERLLYAEAKERLALEAKAAAQLRSPHVVQILDQGEHAGVPYIAMELLDGEDLAARLLRVGHLDTATALDFVVQIGKALAKAHASGLVHRDLKPANVFVARDAESEVVKVLDFGIAKRVFDGAPKSLADKDATRAAPGATRAGAILGTPNYMSPEQIDGAADVDARTDLWSLGVLAFECLTGRIPFESDSLAELFVKIQTEPLPRPSSILGELPPGVDAWFSRACARPRDERFQSARDMTEALARALGRESSLRSITGAAAPVIAAAHTASPAPPPDFGFAATQDMIRPRSDSGDVDVGAPTERAGASAPKKKNKRSFAPWAVGGACVAVIGAGVPLGIHYYPTDVARSSRPAKKVATPAAPTPVALPTATVPSSAAATAPTVPCNVSNDCVERNQEVCRELTNHAFECVRSPVAGYISLKYSHEEARWNGVARNGTARRNADGSLSVVLDYGETGHSVITITFPKELQSGPRSGQLSAGDITPFVEIEERDYPQGAPYGFFGSRRALSYKIESAEFRPGGFLEGSVLSLVERDSANLHISGSVLIRTFRAEIPR